MRPKGKPQEKLDVANHCATFSIFIPGFYFSTSSKASFQHVPDNNDDLAQTRDIRLQNVWLAAQGVRLPGATILLLSRHHALNQTHTV
ncbi:hypothetical protein ED733_006950 [Metarhizium rileyi]|uniref:Uncharacterized protein n=1 Tax=Metarhizium rileyi (strain RCEF 4871) TaxID=1649241 RepID=A0A5C6GDH0_METRR|nr:hypothetical protein ED733_006950 [Metarhizium rileyi]